MNPSRSRLAPALLLFLSLAFLAAKPTADQRAEELLSAMKRGDFVAAYETFDQRMKDAVPPDKLREGWNGQAGPLGKVVKWTIHPGAPVRGQEIRTATIEMERGTLLATIAVDPASGDVSGFFIKPGESNTPPPPPKSAPYVDRMRFTEKPVTVTADSFALSGTLTVPTDLGPFPGVVLVHGSGPQDRDETIGPNHVFKDLGEGLSSRGIAVLRYDKRTFQYKDRLMKMDVKSITLDDEVVNDAAAAVRVLKSMPGIDSTRVYVVGHSLGALLAPEIAFRSHAAGAVLLAPPGRPPWVIIAAQMKTMGASAADVAEAERKGAKIEKGTLGDETLLGLARRRRDGEAHVGPDPDPARRPRHPGGRRRYRGLEKGSGRPAERGDRDGTQAESLPHCGFRQADPGGRHDSRPRRPGPGGESGDVRERQRRQARAALR
jgi:dienelactone hydrolase